jgi:hypothetical protein
MGIEVRSSKGGSARFQVFYFQPLAWIAGDEAESSWSEYLLLTLAGLETVPKRLYGGYLKRICEAGTLPGKM